ncbi:MAG: GNAT family N-acetyltransferase [Gallionellaceae bacterium]
MISYQIKPLDATTDRAGFLCGHAQLDEYFCRHASQDVRRNIARVFVAVSASNPQQIAGFFTLSAASVNSTSLPETLARKLPRYPIPVALIGRLAVDVNFQGKGLGSILLADACQKVVQASSILAVAGIIVDTKDEQAVAFYKHFGFIGLAGSANRMLLPSSVLFGKSAQ